MLPQDCRDARMRSAFGSRAVADDCRLMMAGVLESASAKNRIVGQTVERKRRPRACIHL
jgi:hypothetical protein